jgi:S-adenosylmethionine synthetase
VQVAYAIGVADPVSVMIETFGTGTVPDTVIEKAVREVFDLKPRAIIDALKLRNPIYRETAAYGHFGRRSRMAKVTGPSHDGKPRKKRTVELFTWEKTDRAAALRKAADRLGTRRSRR